jgi:hypothetical protein
MAKNKAKTKLIKLQNTMGKKAGRAAWKLEQNKTQEE